MKFTERALRDLIRESIGKDRIIKERPWSVEYEFKLSGGIASDSEGKGPDGFAIVMRSSSGRTARVYVDSYWNPQAGDVNGNSLRIEMEDNQSTEGAKDFVTSTYVPIRFDDGKRHSLTISNSPTANVLCVSHGHLNEVPIVYLAVENPFEEGEDLEFEVETVGNGEAEVTLKRHVNL